MASVERDPSGLLQRVPELGPLAEAHPSLKRAIEQGRPHAVYRALLWIRWLGKAGTDAALITQLLATRRPFIAPLSGAPTMLTLNGCGSRPYGKAERDSSDGSHIITLYLVLVFVPVYPFSAYLVRPATRGWSFFGKVPLSGAGYLWQRGVALLGLLAVFIGGLNALGAMRYNTVQIVNALPTPMQVTIGKEPPVTVLGKQIGKVRSKIGTQDVVVKLDGQVLEQGKIEVKRGFDVNAWNILGAGALYRDDVVYVAKGATPLPRAAQPDLICGEHTILQDGIDYVFTTPPSDLAMRGSEHEKETRRSHFGLAELPPVFCVHQLVTLNKLAEANALAKGVALASDYDLETVEQLQRFYMLQGDAKSALELVDAARKKHDDVIEFHRQYQDQLLSVGKRGEALEEYEARAQKQPDSADAAYLLGRLMSGKAGDRYVSESQTRFPRHPYILRSAAYRALARADFAEVERLVDSLRSIDVKMWQSSLDLELRALAASSKVDKARGLVSDCLKSPNLDASDRFETVVDGLLLTHFEPKFRVDSMIETLHGDNEQETAEMRLSARVNGCDDVSDGELGKLEDKLLKSRLGLELAARKDPQAALAQVVAADENSLGITAAAWALLVAESARLDEHHPALARLGRVSPVGSAGLSAFTRYVREGVWNAELEELPQEVIAAADFVRSRAASAASEALALRSKATREDMLHGAVSVAMNEWPR